MKEAERKKRKKNYNTLMVGVFVVASGLLGIVKMPSFLPSIALDSTPAYFIAGYLGPVQGGLVGLLGHLVSAATSGFPMGWLHLVVALQMFISCSVFGLIIRAFNKMWALGLAFFSAVLLNGYVAPKSLQMLGLITDDLYKAILGILIFASAINAALALIAITVISKRGSSSL